MSDPRDELLDWIQEELHRIADAVERAFIVDGALVERVVKSREAAETAALAHQIDAQLSRRCALALGRCQEIAVQLLREIEQLKRARAKTSSG